ncbi:MAG: hypothetical protein J5811_00345, partial [Lachnospiraceae bacterium]|nr:hypothetical protein [Lachnospiraceae bacterium]
VSLDDFKGETDENTKPPVPASEPELDLGDLISEEPASEETVSADAPVVDEGMAELEAMAEDAGMVLDPGLFADATDSSAGEAEPSSPADVESMLFSSIDEATEAAESVDSADADGMDELMGLLNSDEITAVDPEVLDAAMDAAASKKAKKKGGFAKMMELLTESDDDDEEEEGGKFSFKDLFKKKKKDEGGEGENPTGADAEGATTDENKEVNRQLDAEEEEGKKKKKKKKRKKGEPEGAEELEEREPHEKVAGGDGEEGEEGGEGDKKGKKKKKKEKKVKEPKPVDNRPLPKLSKKKIKATVFFAFTLLAAIVICCFVLGDVVSKQKARAAYYDGDYETCYRNLYGKNLSEGDENMFKKASMLLSVTRCEERYYEYLAIDDEYHALDALFDGVNNRFGLMQNAANYGFEAEANAAYSEILSILETRYGLSEADVDSINAIEQDAVYTLYIHSIVDGTEFVIPEYLEDGYFDRRVNEIMSQETSPVEETNEEYSEEINEEINDEINMEEEPGNVDE